jgi:hypothetical protein
MNWQILPLDVIPDCILDFFTNYPTHGSIFCFHAKYSKISSGKKNCRNLSATDNQGTISWSVHQAAVFPLIDQFPKRPT